MLTKKEKLGLHAEISYYKSALRIIGYCILPFGRLDFAALFLITAEVFGVLEEYIL